MAGGPAAGAVGADAACEKRGTQEKIYLKSRVSLYRWPALNCEAAWRMRAQDRALSRLDSSLSSEHVEHTDGDGECPENATSSVQPDSEKA